MKLAIHLLINIFLITSLKCLSVSGAQLTRRPDVITKLCDNPLICNNYNLTLNAHLNSTSSSLLPKSIHKRDLSYPFQSSSDYFFHNSDTDLDLSEATERITGLRRVIFAENTGEHRPRFTGQLYADDEASIIGDTRRFFLPPKTRRKSSSSTHNNRPDEYDAESEFLHDVEANSRREKALQKSDSRPHSDGGEYYHHERPKPKSTSTRYAVPYISAIRNSSMMMRSEEKRKSSSGGQQSLPRLKARTSSRRNSRRRSDDDANPVSSSRYETVDEPERRRRRGYKNDAMHHQHDTDPSLIVVQPKSGRSRMGSDSRYRRVSIVNFNSPSASSSSSSSNNNNNNNHEDVDNDSSNNDHSNISGETDPLTPNQSSDNQVNQVYRPNYQHYESRGSFPQSNYRLSNDRAIIKIEPNGNIVYPNTRNRYYQSSRPQSLSEYRSQNVFNMNNQNNQQNNNRIPTILIPNQDIRQLSRNFFATPSPLSSSINPAPVAYDRASSSSSRNDARRTQLYRTVMTDHNDDGDDERHQPRSMATTTPRPTTEATVSIQTIPFDYHYHYERDKRPTYDYQDQPEPQYRPLTTTTSTPSPAAIQNRHNQRYRTNSRPPYYATERPNGYDQPSTLRSPQFTATTTPSPAVPSQPNTPVSDDYEDQPISNQARLPPPVRPAGRPFGSSGGGGGGGNGNASRRRRRKNRPSTPSTTSTTTAQPAYYYDEYEGDEYDDYETTTTTARPRRKGRRRSSTTRPPTTTPSTTTTTLSPGYKHRSDNRIIDYMADPNFPHELKGADLTDYPFYISLPQDIHFNCEGRHDGYYASIEHKCQVYHHCALGHRYDFLCPNYTLFDQTTFTCRFVNTVDCLKSENHFNRNDELYVETTEETDSSDVKPKLDKDKERQKREKKANRKIKTLKVVTEKSDEDVKEEESQGDDKKMTKDELKATKKR